MPAEGEHGGAFPDALEDAPEGEWEEDEGEGADGEAEGLGEEGGQHMAVGEVADGGGAAAGGAGDAGHVEHATGGEAELLVAAGTRGVGMELEADGEHGGAGGEDGGAPDADFEAFLGGGFFGKHGLHGGGEGEFWGVGGRIWSRTIGHIKYGTQGWRLGTTLISRFAAFYLPY
jgi:hypothetical protein